MPVGSWAASLKSRRVSALAIKPFAPVFNTFMFYVGAEGRGIMARLNRQRKSNLSMAVITFRYA